MDHLCEIIAVALELHFKADKFLLNSGGCEIYNVPNVFFVLFHKSSSIGLEQKQSTKGRARKPIKTPPSSISIL